MVDLQDPFAIGPLILLLVPAVGGFQGEFSLTCCRRVEDSDIKECLLPIRPESSGTHVHSSFIGGVGRPVPQVFSLEG